ncbi:g10539 [Coccomyxa elongata]
MQVLQLKLEATCPHGPGFDRINSQSVQPILLYSSKSLKAALRMCPLLQIIQWQPQARDELRNPILDRVSALMASCCLHLTHLSLAFCTLHHATMSVLGQSRSLKVLSLRHSQIYSLNCQMHEEAWQGFPQLHCLDLSWCPGVVSNHLLLVAPHLLSLSAHGCDRVGRLLCRHLRSCVCLDICGTGMCDRDLLALIEGAPDLRHLYISGRYANLWSDPFWTDAALSELKRRRPDVVVRTITSPLTPTEYERLGTNPSSS